MSRQRSQFDSSSPPRDSRGRFLPKTQSSSWGRSSSPTRSYGRRRSPPPGSSRGEEICRAHMERTFGVKFNPARPDWLKNPHTGRNMELDCYNEKLGIAVEYNGRQHYEYSPHFHHNDPMEFQEQRQRDSLKRRRCKARGEQLIEVHDQVPYEEIPDFIDDELKYGKR